MKGKFKSYIRLPLALWYRGHKTEIPSQDTSTGAARQKRVEHCHDEQHSNFLHYGDLALDIATATNLKQALPDLLSPIQQQLNLCFTADASCHVHIALTPTLNILEPDIIHVTNSVHSPIVINQLRIHFSHQKSQTNNPQQFVLTGCQSSIYSQLLTPVDTFPRAYLVLVFNNKMPSPTTIHHYSSSISHILSRGLCASFERERQIQQAISLERSAQAAELHDSMAQILGYLRLKTSQLVSTCKDQNNPALEALSSDIAHQTHYAYRTTRELISTSRLSIQDKNLSQIIREAMADFEQQSNIVFELDNRAIQGDNVGKREAQLQFIVREALSNIVRHSHATHARILLNSDENHLTIKIEDNGHGIKQEHISSNSFGLTIMRERADKIGATFHIKNREPHGTVIEIKHRYSK